MTVEGNAVNESILQEGPETLPEIENTLVMDIFPGKLAGFPQPHVEQHVLRSGPPAGLMTCPMDKRFKGRSFPDIQRAYAFGCIYLMTGQGQQVYTQVIDCCGYLSHRLGSIRMEEDPVVLRDLCNLVNRLDGSRFIVGMHDGNKNGLASYGFFNAVGINPSVPIHADTGHRRPKSFQKAAGIEDGSMFYLRRDDVIAFLPQGKEDRSEE